MLHIEENIKAATGRIKPTLVLKNLSIINVFDESIEVGDIAAYKDTIVGIGSFEGEKEIDCTGLYAAPGFIDSHVHIESSMVTPDSFSKLAIRRGVTTVIADPHEIANVMGMAGVNFMLESSKKGSIDIFFMLPSCVPCAAFEDNAGVLQAEQLSQLINHRNILGLGEVMDVPSVLNCSSDMIKKLKLAEDKIIDGHCPNIDDVGLNGYIAGGVKTDHECSTPEEAIRKVKRGMYVLIREGSAARNLSSLVSAVTDSNYHRFLFCTDDRHIDDIYTEGSIDYCVRKAIKCGMKPIRAFTIASLNAAQCYELKNTGAIAPGFKADIVVFQDINNVDIKYVIKNGIVYNDDTNSEIQCCRDEMTKLDHLKTFLQMDYVDKSAFRIEKKSDRVNVIKLVPNSIETLKVIRNVSSDENGTVTNIQGEDILKIGVFERHRMSGKRAVGFVEGFGLKNCSIAQTIAHDSHNVVVIGDNDNDMSIAVNSLINIGGGIAIVSKGKLLEYISLPIGGLMTQDSSLEVLEKVRILNRIARQFGIKEEFDSFITLAFLALPVIPEIRITARGIFEYEKFDFIDLFC